MHTSEQTSRAALWGDLIGAARFQYKSSRLLVAMAGDAGLFAARNQHGQL
jgi:hypothetical protein